MPPYQRISRSRVARHPHPIGVVEFYGGEVFAVWPTFFYGYFLAHLYNAGYTLIVVPVQFGLDHQAIACTLLDERDAVRAALPGLDTLPHFWVGHSVGGEIIALLEAWTNPQTNLFVAPGLSLQQPRSGVRDQPALLLAPDIADTQQAIPIRWLARLIEALGWGVKPSKPEIQALIAGRDLHNPTALISFRDDTIAGNAEQPPSQSDVAWFIQTYTTPHPELFVHHEIAGGHLEPIAFRVGRWILAMSWNHPNITPDLPRPLEPLALALLTRLGSLSATRRADLQAGSAERADI